MVCASHQPVIHEHPGRNSSGVLEYFPFESFESVGDRPSGALGFGVHPVEGPYADQSGDLIGPVRLGAPSSSA